MGNSIKELKLQVSALFDIVSEDSECFKGIRQYAGQLKDLLNSDGPLELDLISKRVQKIDELLDRWRESPTPTPGVLYIEPNEVTAADEVLKEIQQLLPQIQDSDNNNMDAQSATETSMNKAPITETDKNIFIVHGRNEAQKLAVAAFLKQIGLTPVILHEQANKGRTVIEKFSDHSNVKFAIVLFTGDDEGRLIEDGSSLRPRARQNVVFEHGFFIGKLGRDRVCALYENGVEMPSDYNGVLYVPLDEKGAWKLELCKELRAAGFVFDANKLI